MIKFGGKEYRNLPEQVAQNANDIEDLKKLNTLSYYHRIKITVYNKDYYSHFYHYKKERFEKKEFIDYIKKVKDLNIDFRGTFTNGYVPLSFNWPIAEEDILEMKTLYVYPNSTELSVDNDELNLEDWEFEDTVIDL